MITVSAVSGEYKTKTINLIGSRSVVKGINASFRTVPVPSPLSSSRCPVLPALNHFAAVQIAVRGTVRGDRSHKRFVSNLN